MTLFVYTAGDPAAMSPAVREVAKSLGPDIPIGGVHTMQEFFDTHGMLGARLMAQLVGAMGAIGLTLGVLGVYAVVAFVVSRRTRELGIRMALGATAGSVLRGVLASGARVALAGIAIGLAGAFALTRYFTDFLDRVSPRDPMVFSGVAIFLLSAALAACWAPARRASRVDPAVTLRYD
jgi:ABC-type antimicrobial peptide transport system permease subunit